MSGRLVGARCARNSDDSTGQDVGLCCICNRYWLIDDKRACAFCFNPYAVPNTVCQLTFGSCIGNACSFNNR